ncbi:MAG: c-type cytochrome [Chloroflexi bacterium]|nr:c-type cytochrome [Chloroflexota bacterium]
MRKHLTIGLVVVFALLVVGCAAPTPAPQPTAIKPAATTAPQPTATRPAATAAPTAAPTTAAAPKLSGDLVRGGVLYDTWWEVIEAKAPTGDQPLWKTQTTNTRKGEITWRCKECHGWDYKGKDGAYGSGSHKTGFVGIAGAKTKPAADVLASLKGKPNADHDFSKFLKEQDLIDLTVFITEGQIDTATMVNADKSSKGGDAVAGKSQYGKVCTDCHGPNGNAINFGTIAAPEVIGILAADNPWEFIHKVRVGQPGWPMPSGITNNWKAQDYVNVLAYAQTLSKTPGSSEGGPLYDAWWKVTGAEAPKTDQVLWKTQTTNTRTGPDTWRCKECHGWDYKGKDGAYGSGSHKTGFTGVLKSATLSADDLTAWLTGKKNKDHDFSANLDAAQVKALVTFVQKEIKDTAAYINADKSVKGDAEKGKTTFRATCAACHGSDGKKINFGDDKTPEYVGTLAADNPWEFFHKVLSGQPGEPMPSGFAMGWTLEDIANLAAYARTLPIK